MTADPPASLLITPDQRRRLQQQYEEAQRLAAKPRGDFRRIHERLAGCVAADPANILYLDALLANLRRRAAEQRRSRWRRLSAACGRFWRTRLAVKPLGRKHSIAGDSQIAVANEPHAVLAGAPQWLWDGASDPALLRELAAAAEQCDYDEVELRYLAAARALAPDDVATQRAVARALTRQGRFEDAVGPWFAVLALAPGDAEAAQAIEDLRGAGELASEENQLAQEHAAAGGDLTLLARREDLRLRHSEVRVAIAARRAEHEDHPKTRSLVARLAAEGERLALEILNLRAERLPQAAGLRLELARRLKRIGNFSGAVQRLDEALRLAQSKRQNAEPAADELIAAILIELGECWQHLRQFTKALDYYGEAIASLAAAAPDDPALSEPWKLARYRSGVLASALGKTGLARQHLTEVVRADRAYKDAAERLDKLPLN